MGQQRDGAKTGLSQKRDERDGRHHRLASMVSSSSVLKPHGRNYDLFWLRI